jgi:hypothetical protein
MSFGKSILPELVVAQMWLDLATTLCFLACVAPNGGNVQVASHTASISARLLNGSLDKTLLVRSSFQEGYGCKFGRGETASCTCVAADLAVENRALSGPLVAVPQYEPASQMRRVAVVLCHLRHENRRCGQAASA